MDTLFADVARYPGDRFTTVGLIIGGAACGGFLLLLVAFFLFRGGKKPVEPATGLLEDLATYPPPPPRSNREFTVQGRPSRLRLIVVAPVGKRDLREYGETEELLNKVVRGLGDVAKEDKPRIRLWPPQLSNKGFTLTFFRNTQRPPDRLEASHWVLVAGPAKAGELPILLGLAVWSEEPSDPGQLSMEPQQWAAMLRVQT